MVNDTSGTMFIFTFGPVQSFITTARRTQDLWAGSRLLSHLAEVAISTAVEDLGVELLYPARTPFGSLPESLPNKLVGRVSDRGVPSAVAQDVHDEWLRMAQAVKDYFSRLAPADGWQETWERQVHQWLETYWVLSSGDLENYGSAYSQAKRALSARKLTRGFTPIQEPGNKCTLCGDREALHGQEGRWVRQQTFWAAISDKPQVTGAQVRPEGRERLCAICIVKRFLQDATDVLGQERFPSTSSIAAAPFKAGLLDNWSDQDLAGAVQAHLEVLSQLRGARFPRPEPVPYLELRARPHGMPARELLHYDGDFFYPETFEEDQLAEALGHALSDQEKALARSATGTLRTLLKRAQKLNISPPARYLAALALDGDHMGQLLDTAQDPEEHRRISQALANFAQASVPDIIERGDLAARVVYAGGDDVLALMPIQEAVQVADNVRRTFAKVMSDAGYPDCHASAGVAIFHHKYPLDDGLQVAYTAQATAKDDPRYGRNAIVVKTLRRSGEPREAGLNWTYPGVDRALAPIFSLQKEMAMGRLSSRFAYALAQEANALMAVPDAWEEELGRLLKRQQGEGLTPDQKQVIDGLAQPLANLAQASAGGLLELTEWVLLARFLAQGGAA